MAKKKTKSGFIGMKVTAEQAELLARLQKALNLPTKTEVLLRGLDALADSYPSSSATIPRNLVEDHEVPSQIATSLELARFEAEARRFSMTVQQAKNRTKEVITQVTQELFKTDKIVDKYEGDKSSLIQVLLELQRENRWLSENTLMWVSQKLGVPLTQIYHVATFYKAFSLVPKGRHLVTVCMGTACQVRGAVSLLDKVTTALNMRPGETSRDMRFSLDTVNCLGCCALGPVMVVNEEYHSKPSTRQIDQIFTACE